MMQLPSLFIIGAPKSGTTTLFNLLMQLPNLIPSSVKEPNFFEYDKNFARGIASYRSLFPGIESSTVQKRIGYEATPWYLYSPSAANRINQVVGQDARFIICVRDPIARAASHYADFVGGGKESDSFRKAFEKELARVQVTGPVFRGRSTGYLSGSHYSESFMHWLELYSNRSFFIVDLSEIRDNPHLIVRQLCNWIGIPPPAGDLKIQPAQTNRASEVRSKQLENRIGRLATGPVGSTLLRLLPWTFHARLGRTWRRANRRVGSSMYPELSDLQWLREVSGELFYGQRQSIEQLAFRNIDLSDWED